MKGKSQYTVKLAVVLLLLSAAASNGAVRYVALDGSDTDGRSWATAYRTVAGALNDPAVGSGSEIRVKRGVYRVTYPITVSKAVKIYGGYSGSGNTRDSKVYLTTLDASDDWSCFRVRADAHIDGFTLANGHAWGTVPEERGGGIYIDGASPTISDCRFYRCHASYAGGGIAANNADGATIRDCIFIENSASWYGGGIYTYRSSLTITGCVLEKNKSNLSVDSLGGGGICNEDGAPTIADCHFSENTAYYGAGIANYYADARIERCVFEDSNSVTTGGGGLLNYGASPRISDCLFVGNKVNYIGGAILDKSTAVITNCVLWKNSSFRYGGGVYIDASEADTTSAAILTNCTFYDNSATRGGGLYSNNASATLTNCILWGNRGFVAGRGIYNSTLLFNAKTVATYCNIEDDTIYPGTGNVLVDPGFVNPSNGDFHLPFGSPCIDVGSNSAPGIPSTDYEGKPRISDGNEDGVAIADMGAFEFRGRVVEDYLRRAQLAQGQTYDSPTDTMPTYTFIIEFETAGGVASIQFQTPGGNTYTISSAAHSSSAFVDTYHRVDGNTHIWTYSAEFSTSAPLADYGDGTYHVTLRYVDGTTYQTTLWYGVPGTGNTLPQPTQKPNVTAPTYGGNTTSPVTFTWTPYPNINSVCVTIASPSGGPDVVNDCVAGNATRSNAHTLDEGVYNAKLSFENSYEVTNADGIPFTYGKSVFMGYRFQVPYTAVYRFWAPVANMHFYTLSARERDKLINDYSDVWTYEGTAYHACATRYYMGLVPVYRFWSDLLGSHFYTIRESEKAKLIDEWSDAWTYEGIAFYAYPEGKQPAECKPVYRFWNDIDGHHFFTMRESEKDKIINQFSHVYIYEGIAYYAYE